MPFIDVQTTSRVIIASEADRETSHLDFIQHHLLKQTEIEYIIAVSKNSIVGPHIDVQMKLSLAD